MSERNGHHGEAATDELLSLPIPRGWARTNITCVGDVRLGRQRSPKNRSADHPTKYLRAANITWNGLDLTDLLDMEFRPDERATYRLQAGDVLLSEASGSATEVGKPAIWNAELEDCCFQNTVIRLKPSIIQSEFLLDVFWHFYVNKVFAKVAAGVGINHLSAAKFSRMVIPLPPLAEQQQIVAEVAEKLSQIEAAEVAIEHGLRRPPAPEHPQAGLRGKAGPPRPRRRTGERAAATGQGGTAFGSGCGSTEWAKKW